MALHLYIVMTRLVFGSVVINTLDWDNSTPARGAPSVCWEYSREGYLQHLILFSCLDPKKGTDLLAKTRALFQLLCDESYQLWIARCLFPLWHPVCCPLKKALLPSFLNVALNCVRNFGVVCVLLTFSVVEWIKGTLRFLLQLSCVAVSLHFTNTIEIAYKCSL